MWCSGTGKLSWEPVMSLPGFVRYVSAEMLRCGHRRLTVFCVRFQVTVEASEKGCSKKEFIHLLRKLEER
ncbi:hypothetical protein VFPPC_15773 [Pochonia chlamydosporia 170]|uniref:Uncharacterized protein n=1 Tax=Pochonia chlamydosporia 170 TaxID=1380566 RepID=A0A179FSD7_METCM|nr:hypothetical protein VFPPC_15773 [Pochonia chlamydosporia 170]OAQ68051.1 hypothetical protein VFPPC_15773 [Pochonia chlamydosporia 170]